MISGRLVSEYQPLGALNRCYIHLRGLIWVPMITRVKNAYRGRRTVQRVFEAPRVLETVQYMSRMKALGLLIPKVTLGSRIGGLDQKLWPLEVRSLFPSEPKDPRFQSETETLC